jgi:hypothetical protein
MPPFTRLPDPTPANLIPPNLEHKSFDGGEVHPFRPGSSSFDLVDAWWLAEAALLAYADLTHVQRQCAPVRFQPELFDDRERGTQAYLLVRDDVCVVAFRGTQVPKPDPGSGRDGVIAAILELIMDVVSDVGIILFGIDGGGRVHNGFNLALKRIYPELQKRLDELRNQKLSRPFFFTGHSLGAALATLAAARYEHVHALYTFGSPRVGDALFASSLPLKLVFRIVNNNDIITRVPLVGPLAPPPPGLGRYEHVGALKYIDSGGAIRNSPPLLARFFDGVAGQVRAFEKTLERLPPRFELQVPFDAAADHAPLYYALHLRNALA